MESGISWNLHHANMTCGVRTLSTSADLESWRRISNDVTSVRLGRCFLCVHIWSHRSILNSISGHGAQVLLRISFVSAAAPLAQEKKFHPMNSCHGAYYNLIRRTPVADAIQPMLIHFLLDATVVPSNVLINKLNIGQYI
jgi:hypothetical protein